MRALQHPHPLELPSLPTVRHPEVTQLPARFTNSFAPDSPPALPHPADFGPPRVSTAPTAVSIPEAASNVHLDGSTGHDLRTLTAEELRHLQKSAKDMGVPRLANNSTFGLFSAWKSAVTDWLGGPGVDPNYLHPDSIKYLAHRLFTAEFHEELRR